MNRSALYNAIDAATRSNTLTIIEDTTQCGDKFQVEVKGTSVSAPAYVLLAMAEERQAREDKRYAAK